MSDIFQVGDVVYHSFYGKGVFTTKNNEYISVEFDPCCRDVLFSVESANKMLSFSPWPEPNHVRPLRGGVYKVEYCGEPWVLSFVDGKWYFVNSQFTHMLGAPVSNQDEVENLEFLYAL